MPRVELSTVIDRPPNEVFAYLTGFNLAAEWQAGVLASTSPNGQVTVGSTIREIRSMFGTKQEFLGVVTAYDPVQRTYTGRTTSGPFPAQAQWTVAPAAGGSRVSVIEQGWPRGPMKLMDPLISVMFRKALGASLINLKRVLESGAAARVDLTRSGGPFASGHGLGSRY